jgi:hypothetical protein
MLAPLVFKETLQIFQAFILGLVALGTALVGMLVPLVAVPLVAVLAVELETIVRPVLVAEAVVLAAALMLAAVLAEQGIKMVRQGIIITQHPRTQPRKTHNMVYLAIMALAADQMLRAPVVLCLSGE